MCTCKATLMMDLERVINSHNAPQDILCDMRCFYFYHKGYLIARGKERKLNRFKGQKKRTKGSKEKKKYLWQRERDDKKMTKRGRWQRDGKEKWMKFLLSRDSVWLKFQFQLRPGERSYNFWLRVLYCYPVCTTYITILSHISFFVHVNILMPVGVLFINLGLNGVNSNVFYSNVSLAQRS